MRQGEQKGHRFAGISISVGTFAYLVCLATSDVIVDVYGPGLGYRLVRLATVMNMVALLFGQLALRLPIAPEQEALQPHFAAVFDASAAVIVASVMGFPITDAFETYLWKRIKTLTPGRHLWLRNAVVKLPGQMLDATIFFTLAFFVLPQFFYGEPLVATSAWWSVMTGAWLYGLWKGCVGTLNYPFIRLVIPWIRAHREPDIAAVDERVSDEAWTGRW
ncbi:MAG: queuosine precursor transporter [Pseudonocardiaceae bacterium]